MLELDEQKFVQLLKHYGAVELLLTQRCNSAFRCTEHLVLALSGLDSAQAELWRDQITHNGENDDTEAGAP